MAKEVANPSKSKKVAQSNPTLSPLEEMQHMFDGFLNRGWPRPFRWDWPSWNEMAAPFENKLPYVDVIDREAEIVVRAEVPGVDKKDLDVSMTDNTVIIKGSTQHEEKEEKGDYYRREMSKGSFSRTVALPGNVDGAKAKATFKDGVLELILPKVDTAKRRKLTVE